MPGPFYIDNVDGSDSNSGLDEDHPVRTWNCAALGSGTFQPNTRIRLAGGKPYSLSSRIQYGMTATPANEHEGVVWESYGNGMAILNGNGTINAMMYPPPINSANAGRYTTFQNLHFTNSGGVMIFMWDSADALTTPAYNTVRGCRMTYCGGTDTPAIQSWGVGTVYEDNLIEDSAWDSLHIKGLRNRASRNTILRPGRTTPTGGDDCIQCLGDTHGCIIEDNLLDKRGYGVWKQGVVAKGNGTIVRGNIILGPSDGAGLLTLDGGSGMQVYGNYLEGNDGIYALDSTGPHDIYSNIVVGTDPKLTNAQSTGIDHFNSVMRNHRIRNNTIVGHKRGIFAQDATVQNNLVINCGGVGIDLGAGAAVEAYNDAYNNGTNFSGTKGTGSMSVDPELRDDYVPMAERLRRAGVWLPGNDYYGKRRGSPCTIGAVEYQHLQQLLHHLARAA